VIGSGHAPKEQWRQTIRDSSYGLVAAFVIAAIDQHIADAGCAQFAEEDFLPDRSSSWSSASF
jgi:hypothetical protein